MMHSKAPQQYLKLIKYGVYLYKLGQSVKQWAKSSGFRLFFKRISIVCLFFDCHEAFTYPHCRFCILVIWCTHSGAFFNPICLCSYLYQEDLPQLWLGHWCESFNMEKIVVVSWFGPANIERTGQMMFASVKIQQCNNNNETPLRNLN